MVSLLKRLIEMLPPFKNEFIKAQINQINKAYQSGGRLVFKPTRKQIEGGFLSTVRNCIKRTPSIKRTVAEVPKFITLIYF